MPGCLFYRGFLLGVDGVFMAVAPEDDDDDDDIARPVTTWIAPTSKCMHRYSPTMAVIATDIALTTYLAR